MSARSPDNVRAEESDDAVNTPPAAPKELPTDMSPEDVQAVVTLYQRHPTLWGDFNLVVQLVDSLRQHPGDYDNIRDHLIRRLTAFGTAADGCTYNDVMGQMYVRVGAVDVLVNVYRQICQDKWKRSYFTELTPPFSQSEMWCVYCIKSMFLSVSCFGMEFRWKLARCGFLDFVLDDLRHMKHMSGAALKSSSVYIESMGTLFNCCRHPEVVSLLRKNPDVVDVVKAFARKDVFVIKGLALITLAFLVEDSDLDLIELDCATLTYFLDTTSASFTSQGRDSEGWQTDAVVHGLARFARNDVNCRCIVILGGLKVLVRVLDTADHQVQKDVVMECLTSLSRDPANLYTFKMFRQLQTVLHRLRRVDTTALRQQAEALCALMKHQDEPEDSAEDSECPFLRENSNALEIVGVGPAEYVLGTLERLDGSSQALEPVLQALLYLAKDDNKRRDMFARGILDVLQSQIEKGDPAVQVDVLNALGDLASSSSSAEYGHAIMCHGGLQKGGTQLIHSNNLAVSQAADRLMFAIKDVTSFSGPLHKD